MFFAVKMNVATTAALMSVCYGEVNPIYRNLINIYNILRQKEVMQAKANFKVILSRQVTRTITDDMRSYFATRLMPEDFKKGQVPFPMSFLQDIFSNINFQNPIERQTFPYACRVLEKTSEQEGGTTKVGNAVGNQGGNQYRGRGGNSGWSNDWRNGGTSQPPPPPPGGRSMQPYLPPPPPGYSHLLAHQLERSSSTSIPR